MGISISSGVPAAAAPIPQPTAASATTGAGTGSAPLPDFGPAVVLDTAAFDQAIAFQMLKVAMYDSKGTAISLTQWLRAGTLPAPQSVQPTSD